MKKAGVGEALKNRGETAAIKEETAVDAGIGACLSTIWKFCGLKKRTGILHTITHVCKRCI